MGFQSCSQAGRRRFLAVESTGGGLQWLSSFGDLGVPIRRGKRGSLVAVSIAGRTLNQALAMS